jgi:hypothetical protein
MNSVDRFFEIRLRFRKTKYQGGSMRLLWSSGLVLILFAAPLLGQPQGNTPVEKKVDCDKGSQSISSAVSNLEADKNYVIRVSGTCDENIFINGFEGISLLIVGDPTATVNGVAGATFGMPVIVLSSSRRVSIANLTVNTTGGTAPSANPVGISMSLCRGCQVVNTTINTSRVAMAVSDSQASVINTTINASTAPSNGLQFLSASDGFVANLKAHSTSNTGAGLLVDQSSRVRLSSSTPTSFSIDGFAIGISVQNAGSLEAGTACPSGPLPSPPTTCLDVHDNNQGVQIQSAQAFFAGLRVADNHQGILVGNAGTLRLNAPSSITGSDGGGGTGFGLLVTHNSHAVILGTPTVTNGISNNNGRGVAVASNSSVEFGGIPIGTTITLNDGALADVACDATSLITGTNFFTADGGLASCATTNPIPVPIP